jgi:hypothetical protein
VSRIFKIPLTNRPFFDWKVLVRLKKTEDGYDAVYRTERIHIYGMPEVTSLSQRDMIAYLCAINEGADEETDEPSELGGVLRQLNTETY